MTCNVINIWLTLSTLKLFETLPRLIALLLVLFIWQRYWFSALRDMATPSGVYCCRFFQWEIPYSGYISKLYVYVFISKCFNFINLLISMHIVKKCQGVGSLNTALTQSVLPPCVCTTQTIPTDILEFSVKNPCNKVYVVHTYE